MLQTRSDVATILLRRKIVSRRQVHVARRSAQRRHIPLERALVELRYASAIEVGQALAEVHGVDFVESLEEVTIPPEIIELIPESVARENVVLPIAQEHGRLMIVLPNAGDQEILDKLRFILNKDIQPVMSLRSEILEAINRHYGQTEVESVDCMLAEFTDTQIDFTETDTGSGGGEKDIFETDFDPPLLDDSPSQAVALDEADTDLASSDFELAVERGTGVVALEEDSSSVDEMLCEDEEEAAYEDLDDEPAPAVAKPKVGARGGSSQSLVQRHATVRFFYRMNPLRMFPLFVIISKKQIEEIVKKHVTQKRSQNFEVALDSVVEVEPILPGCQCYPPKEQLMIRREEVSARFHVVPHVLGELEAARVVIRQNGQVLAEVPLEVRVVQQTLTMLAGGLSLVLPFGLMVLKHFHLDFETQLADEFSLYAQVAHWAVQSLTPEKLAGILLALTGLLYLWLRPRQRDVFWDLRTTNTSALSAPTAPKAGRKAGRIAAPLPEESKHQESLLLVAEQQYVRGDYGTALRYYHSALLLGKARPSHYHHASLSAYHVGDRKAALAFLQELEAQFKAKEVPAAIWYNLGCFCSRLGRHGDAMRYLYRAADAGYDDPEEFRRDPDLEALRWRSDFKRLLGALKRDGKCKGRS